jgi:enoyl-CoA hydratase/carnithine racemase
LVERRGPVALLTLNRPDRLNAITFAMLEALGTALGRTRSATADVRVIVLTGAGRGFCSGLDLKEAAAGRASAARSRAPAASRTSARATCRRPCCTSSTRRSCAR